MVYTVRKEDRVERLTDQEVEASSVYNYFKNPSASQVLTITHIFDSISCKI